MVPGLKVLLFLSLHLLQEVKSSIVCLNNNRYEGVVVVINPSVPEDERLIQSIKADVIIADPYLKYRDDPYTLQYGQCGDRGRVFVHEWAHLWWGVFDEYNRDQPFHLSRWNIIEATRCSTDISGRNMVKERQGGSCISRKCNRDSMTRLYEPKCTFIPNKAQAARDSITFVQRLMLFFVVVKFCTEKTHNREAPNLQNKMCNGRSTWNVIKKSADFQNSSPMIGTEAPPQPTFSLLKSKQRVVCLVLDKYGSMKNGNPITPLTRMNQAAELFLIHIIEKESLVGLVTFDSTATIETHLVRMANESSYLEISANLPQKPGGGTSICSGLRSGFQAITSSNQRTCGSEIILLTDREDGQIRSCFEEVKSSGAIIHPIALGPSAARALEALSSMTGGLRFYANQDVTGLMDAFSGISSRSGRISQQALQTGTWTYSLFNKAGESQSLAMTMTTQARSPTTPPVIATAHMSQNTAWYTSPMIVHARVSQGFLPVLGANVTATIEAEDGHQVTLELWDNGAGADILKNDGVYSRYFTEYHGNGRYSLKVRVQARKHITKVNLEQPNKALYVPGYVENGEILWNPPRPEVSEATDTIVEDFSRETPGTSFTVSEAPPGGDDTPPGFPPSRVTDLQAQFKGHDLHLTLTAPGRILDKGRDDLDAEF